MSIRYRQFCSVKLKLKFSQQTADPRSMFCFSDVHFGIANHWRSEFQAIQLEFLLLTESFSVKYQNGVILFDCICCKIVYSALTLLLYKPWLYFAYLLSNPVEDDSASPSSELKFRAGPPKSDDCKHAGM